MHYCFRELVLHLFHLKTHKRYRLSRLERAQRISLLRLLFLHVFCRVVHRRVATSLPLAIHNPYLLYSGGNLSWLTLFAAGRSGSIAMA